MTVSVPTDLGRLSLLLVLTGISVLYAINAVYTPPAVAVAGIDGSRMGEMVRVTGTVSGVREAGGNTFFTLREGDSAIRAVAFRSGIGLKSGESYHMTGRVDVYRGDPELIVHAVSHVK